MADPFQIRQAIRSDIPALVAIERLVFTDPWPPAAFIGCLTSYVIVAVREGWVVGYLVARFTDLKGEILNLAVHPEDRRGGAAKGLVRRALDDFAGAGVREVRLEVRKSNAPAQSLYRTFGFREVGSRPGYYIRPREDAVVMTAVFGPKKGSQKEEPESRIFG
jgi:ribosomal-protein-alanine N-acetyltransferase